MLANELTTAFVLHQRDYRETSVIVELITASHGYIRAVCKGVKGSGKAALKQRSSLQPFSEISISWRGRGELKTISKLESLSTPKSYVGEVLYAALYINELSVRVSRYDSQGADLFAAYREVLALLAAVNVGSTDARYTIEKALRSFEFCLLKAVGYEVDMWYESENHNPIEPGKNYQFDVNSGFSLSMPVASNQKGSANLKVIPGDCIICIRENRYENRKFLHMAKLLAREALKPLLGGQPIKARELFN